MNSSFFFSDSSLSFFRKAINGQIFCFTVKTIWNGQKNKTALCSNRTKTNGEERKVILFFKPIHSSSFLFCSLYITSHSIFLNCQEFFFCNAFTSKYIYIYVTCELYSLLLRLHRRYVRFVYGLQRKQETSRAPETFGLCYSVITTHAHRSISVKTHTGC